MDGLQRNDSVALGVVVLCIALLLGMMLLTVAGGIYAALHHPGDTTLDMLYAAVVYTSPYVVYGALGMFMYKLKKSRSISLTFLVGVGGMIATWVYKNLLQINEDVSFAYSLYDTQYRCFAQSAVLGGVFVGLMVMQAMLIMPSEYDDEDFRDR